MARRPVLSPTRISTYLACPVKYRWTFVDARGKFLLKAKSHYSFGTSLHRALEILHSQHPEGVPPVEAIPAALEESWVKAGYSSQESMAEAYGEGLTMLEEQLDYEVKRGSGRPLYLEREFRYSFPEFDLVGRIDRVDQHPDGSLEIIDYKSYRKGVTAESVRDDIAMSVYQFLLKQRHPETSVRATIIALKNNVEASYSLSDSELAEFEAGIHKIGQEILIEDFPELTPVPKRLCVHCDFFPLCKRHPDFAEAYVDLVNSDPVR